MKFPETMPKLVMAESTDSIRLPEQEEVTSDGLYIVEKSPEWLLSKNPLAVAARSLRARIYIDQQGFLPTTAIDEDGGEHDLDDARSAHFLALRNNECGNLSVIGTMRLISKQDQEDVLPIERFFPEHFEANAVPKGGFEVSRLVTEHQRRTTVNKLASLGLIRAGLKYALAENWSPGYAVVEPPLERRLKAIGVQTTRVAAEKWVEQYQTSNLAVEIGLHQTKKNMDAIWGETI